MLPIANSPDDLKSKITAAVNSIGQRRRNRLDIVGDGRQIVQNRAFKTVGRYPAKIFLGRETN